METFNKIFREKRARFCLLLLCFACFPGLFGSCSRSGGDASKPQREKILSALQLNNEKYTIGGETGTASLRFARETMPKARFKEMSYPVDLYLALETKKIDAVVYDRPPLDYVAAARSEFAVLPEDIGIGHLAVVAPLRHEALIEQVNEFIKTYRADGTYDEMYRRWILTKNGKMPNIAEAEQPTQTLVIGTDCQNEPMNFMGEGGQLSGFDIEFIKRLALFLNAKVEIKLISYEGLFVAAASGKIDLAVAAMDATEERRESVLFSEDYIDNPIAVMIRKEDSANEDGGITDFSQLYEKRIGVMAGSVFDDAAKKHLPSSIPVYLNSVNDMVLALETKKIDAFIMDEPQFPSIAREKPHFKRLPRTLDPCDYAILFAKENHELRDAISEQLIAMKRDGTIDKLEKKWFHGDVSEQIMTPLEGEFPAGTLRFATVSASEPMSFVRDNEIVGYDIECAQQAAARLGYRAEPLVMEWNAYLEAIVAGKVDFGIGSTAVTEERKQKMLFSEPNYRGGVIIVVRKSEADETQTARDWRHWFSRTGEELGDSFERTFLRENRWKLILEGLKVTVLITVLSALFGTVLAFGVCALRRSTNFCCRILGKFCIALMQGMPILVILMILYYVVFARVEIGAVTVAVIGFSLNFSVYVGEMMRSALDGIPKGQYEAAMALGFNRFTAFRKIIFPQMLRRILPLYRGEFISMLKMTSIVGYIAIQDLTKMSDIIRSRTYEAFFPLIATAVIYFIVAHLLTMILSGVEYRLDPKNRRRRTSGKAARKGVTS